MLLPEIVLASMNDATLKSLLKDKTHEGSHPVIQQILATRKSKPKYQFKAKFNDNGGMKMPFVLYRETAEQFIEELQANLSNPEWKGFVPKADR